MFFSVSKIFWFFADPGNLFLIALIVGLALCLTRRRRWGMTLVGAALLGALAVTFLPLGPWMVRTLEDRFAVPDPMPARVTGIVVLGGVIDPRVTAARRAPAIGGAVERITVSAALARHYPEARLIYSGGSGSLRHQEHREADYVAALYEALGVPAARITFERDARNTVENALYARDLARPGADDTWILVTSAFHMPRAMGVFRNVGWEPLPYPVDFGTHPTAAVAPPLRFSSGILSFSSALHEWVGLTAYWLTGKSTSAFPAPAGT